MDGKVAMESGRSFESPWRHMPTVTLGVVFGLPLPFLGMAIGKPTMLCLYEDSVETCVLGFRH